VQVKVIDVPDATAFVIGPDITNFLPIDKICPDIVPIDTLVFSLMFGLGRGPQPKAR
jgi:hypothetical protein